MNQEPADAAWFHGLDPGEPTSARQVIDTGGTENPQDWPALALQSGFVADKAEYYNRLHKTAMTATKALVGEREQAGDEQLKHTIRSMDDCVRTANELAERVEEWAGTLIEVPGSGVELAHTVATHDNVPRPLQSLATRVCELDEQATALRTEVERTAPDVAPNLAAMAGPVLAARLISLGGGLEALAKKPSGTLQVLGAEEALFAHLRGHAPSPKHGVIYTHDAVRNTRLEDRGSASRALAGKLTIAARVDHYSGERKSELDRQLEERIETIRARGHTTQPAGDETGVTDE